MEEGRGDVTNLRHTATLRPRKVKTFVPAGKAGELYNRSDIGSESSLFHSIKYRVPIIKHFLTLVLSFKLFLNFLY